MATFKYLQATIEHFLSARKLFCRCLTHITQDYSRLLTINSKCRKFFIIFFLKKFYEHVLTVHFTPACLVFLPTDALRITPAHLRVREGRAATLICRNNDRTIPTGGITWSGPNGRTYGPASSPLGDRVRAANHFLYITNANRTDHGNSYTIQASKVASTLSWYMCVFLVL